jgi:hypothetical protein
LTVDEAVRLIEQDVDTAPQEAVLYAMSRAELARALAFALDHNPREAKRILESEAETGLLNHVRNF